MVARLRPAACRSDEERQAGARRVCARYGDARLGNENRRRLAARRSTRFKAIAGLTEEQKQRADKALETRLSELADFIAGADEDITDYRHELWRLAEWRKSPEANGVPFYAQRIAAKNSRNVVEGGRLARAGSDVRRRLEARSGRDFNAGATSETRDGGPGEGATADAHQHNLDTVNLRGDRRDDQRRSVPALRAFSRDWRRLWGRCSCSAWSRRSRFGSAEPHQP